MTLTIQFGIPRDISKTLVKHHANKPAALAATILPDDFVVCKDNNMYSIANCSKSVNGHRIYYRYDLDKRPVIIMLSSKLYGELHNARPYKVGLKVSGYINSNNEFVITNVIYPFTSFENNINKMGLMGKSNNN